MPVSAGTRRRHRPCRVRKWGAYDEANISPSPEAFYVGLPEGSRLENELSEIDLNLPIPMTTDPATKIVTYQCLCKVKGKVRFALVNSDETGVLDEIVVESQLVSGSYVYTDTALVTLRAQVFEGGPASVRYAVVVLENLSAGVGDDLSALQVFWQQAWGGSDGQPDDYPLAAGLANSGQARVTTTEPVKNTYNWAVNALGIKAASRFQLPLLDTRPSEGEMDPGGDAAGMGWLSEVNPEDYDLVDGEMYFDANQFAVLGRAALAWTTFVQPERVRGGLADGGIWQGGVEQNLVYSDSSANFILNLETDIGKVPAGSHLRVFNFLSLGAGGSPVVTVKVGGSPLSAVARNKMSEFLFYDDGGTGRWLLLHDTVTTARMP